MDYGGLFQFYLLGGKWMPTYFMSNVMRTLYHEHAVNITNTLGLLGWMIVLGIGLISVLYIKQKKGYLLT